MSRNFKVRVCSVCQADTRSLGKHFANQHPEIGLVEYYHEYVVGTQDVPTCVCGKPVEFVDLVRGYREFCGRSCKSKASGAANAERIKNLSAAEREAHFDRMHRGFQSWLATPEGRAEHHRIASKGGLTCSAEDREAASDRYREIAQRLWKDPEWRERQRVRSSTRMRKTSARLWATPGAAQKMFRRQVQSYKSGEHVSPKAGVVWFRSSYELAAFKLLDQMSVVETYEVEPFPISYGEGKVYIPDILISYRDGSRELVEVKPERLVGLKENKAKFSAARRWCRENDATFEVWTETHLERRQ